MMEGDTIAWGFNQSSTSSSHNISDALQLFEVTYESNFDNSLFMCCVGMFECFHKNIYLLCSIDILIMITKVLVKV